MPGGLRDVNQTFSADASKYLEEVQKIIRANREVLDSIREVQKARADADTSVGGAAAFIRDYNRAIDEHNRAMAEAVKVNKEFSAAQQETARLSAEGQRALDNLAEAHDLAWAATYRHTKAHDDLARAHMREMPLLDQMVSRLGVAKEAYASAADAAERFYGAGGASRGGDAARFIGAGAFGPIPAGGAAFGGGGGGGGAAAGGFFGAGMANRIFGGALPTAQMAHMVTMFTMEALSTIVPAAVAAGAAGVVGLQAGQALYQRGTAMWNAAEALGPAYGGQTLGTMVGLSSNLQRAQDMAQGGVFGIAGGLRDLVGAGSGAFTGMGVQTIAMIDRGIANMVLHNRMGALAQALGGGTGFLRSFGDIGANIGDTLLNLAPNLPGIGPGLLGGLKGITGAASWLTGNIPGALLGAGLAGEAGYRWGGLLLGGGKMPWWLGGGKFGGAAGLAERLGLGTVADAGAGVEGAGLAGLLSGGAAGLPIGALAAIAALSAYGISKGQFGTSISNQMAPYQAAISQSFGAGALHPITSALYQAAQVQQALPGVSYDTIGGQQAAVGAPIAQLMRSQGISRAQAVAEYQRQIASYTQSFAGQLADMVTAGPSAVKALSDIGVKGATLTQAFEAMSMAMISPRDWKGGQLDATARQQLQQFYQTYRTAAIGGQPGTASGLLAAGAADYIMSSPAMKSLSQINQGMDAMTQIMTGGPAGVAALFGMLGGTPVTRGATRAGIQLKAPPAFGAMAGALSNIFTPQGAAAWQTFAGPQGLISAQQANLDQMRTYLTLGAITGQQGAQLSAFELQSMLPLARQSPMALSMLMSLGMQGNIPGMGYYDPKKSLGQNYAQALKAITGSAGTAAGAQGILTQGTEAVSNLPAIAAQLITGGMGGPSAIQSALLAQMSQQALAFAMHPLGAKGGVNIPGLQGLISSLTAGGVGAGKPMMLSVDAILKNLHVPPGVIAKINAEVAHLSVPGKTGTVKYNSQFDGKVPPLKKGVAQYESTFKLAQPPTLHGVVVYSAQMAFAPGSGGVRFHGQSGFKVPGYGGGDIWGPAMLEPGELVVPKDMVAAGAVDHLRGRIPGFAGGSLIFSGGGSGAAAQGFAFTLIDEITKALKSAGAHKIAEALVGKIQQEVGYAKNVAQAAMYGQGFSQSGLGAGIFGNMDVTPGTGQGTVVQQMQQYAQTLQSFVGDIKALRKGKLNKDIIAQLIAAGPVQGDALAQSIMQGYGGIGMVNSLWKQMGVSSKALGAQAAMAQYGGYLAPNLRSASVTENHVTINISGGGKGGLDLTAADIKKLVEEIQAALLKQARRNPKTGLQLSGKGA